MIKKEALCWFGLGLVVLVEGWLKHGGGQGKERILKNIKHLHRTVHVHHTHQSFVISSAHARPRMF